jgi:hypothetical protein
MNFTYRERTDPKTGEMNGYIRIETGEGIPLDPNNHDYQLVQKWIEQGNTPAPAIN